VVSGETMEDGRFRLEDFELYKVAREFRKRAYRLLKQLPPEEKYALAVQMRPRRFPSPITFPKGMVAGTIRRTSTFAGYHVGLLTS